MKLENAVLGYRSPVVGPISHEFPLGKITSLVGRNGAGKTTLIRALLGEDVVIGGEVKNTLGQIGFVGQEAVYPPDLLAEDYLPLAFLPKVGLFGSLPAPDSEVILSALNDFGLFHLRKAPLRNLSTGERQRLYLARAVLQDSKVLILDEPTNHLDPAGVRAFWNRLEQYRGQKTMIVSTHDLSFVETKSDFVLAIADGKVFFSGEREEFVKKQIANQLFHSAP